MTEALPFDKLLDAYFDSYNYPHIRSKRRAAVITHVEVLTQQLEQAQKQADANWETLRHSREDTQMLLKANQELRERIEQLERVNAELRSWIGALEDSMNPQDVQEARAEFDRQKALEKALDSTSSPSPDTHRSA